MVVEGDVEELWAAGTGAGVVDGIREGGVCETIRDVGGGEWSELRDVFEVNGLAVRDRRDRLTHLFLHGSPSAREQVGREPLVGFLVPVEMRENYRDRRGARVEGVAEYSRFRQFQVNVDETFFIRK